MRRSYPECRDDCEMTILEEEQSVYSSLPMVRQSAGLISRLCNGSCDFLKKTCLLLPFLPDLLEGCRFVAVQWLKTHAKKPAAGLLLSFHLELTLHAHPFVLADVGLVVSRRYSSGSMSQRSPNVPYNGGSLLGVAIAMAILQIVGVIARFYTRHSQRIAYALDDFLIVIALIASLGQSALYVVCK
ncbi:hypothetical protein BO99DRAFT_147385 [Aspergillus violaceofuscus CBS 115571]|uniref:Uncharacterized protein n=1 Tax=Aspergillus violaceofuscus (strain CBS 115571) TaxID=1450538 RepID=A0A2V5H6I8_ASPV1|nr:hypothetical protein BO99DRAFT_147385 [Aspergillus violaceofuscus CBS 115571]